MINDRCYVDNETEDKQSLIIKTKMTLLLSNELAIVIGDAMLDERTLNFNEFSRRVFWFYIDNKKNKKQASKEDGDGTVNR